MKNILSPAVLKLINEKINQARLLNVSVEHLQKIYKEAYFEELDRKEAQALLAYLKSQEKIQVGVDFQTPQALRSVTDILNPFADSYLAQDIAEAITSSIVTQVNQHAASGTLTKETAKAVMSTTKSTQLVAVLREAANSRLPETYPNRNNSILNAAPIRYVYHQARQNLADRHAQFVFNFARILSEKVGCTVNVSEAEAAILAFIIARSASSATASTFGSESTLNLNHDPRFVGSVRPPTPNTSADLNKEDVKTPSL